MMKTMTLILFIVAFAAFDAKAEDICRYKADPALSNMKTWADLRIWFENYLICDDGYFSEGISEFITATLAKQWNSIGDLQVEILENPEFKKFVLDHIDPTSDTDNLMTIKRNAARNCPPTLGPLCREMGECAKKAMNETTEIE